MHAVQHSCQKHVMLQCHSAENDAAQCIISCCPTSSVSLCVSESVFVILIKEQTLQALAYQYQCSLEGINDKLPQTDISLVMKQGRLQLEPPLEEIHVAHYKNQLKPLLAIPLNFKVGHYAPWQPSHSSCTALELH